MPTPAAAVATTTPAAAGGEEEDPTTESTTKVDLSLLDTWKNTEQEKENTTAAATTVDDEGGDLQRLTSREAFQSRLKTFRPLTYFCKPPSLSPLVSARFGWENTSIDMLKCSYCKAVLVVQIHPKITRRATVEKLVRDYQSKLATAHKPTCPFRFEAELHLLANNNDTPTPNTVVPSHFVSILPQDIWEMLEKPRPLPYLRERLQALIELLLKVDSGKDQVNPSDGEPPKWQLPPMDLPKEMLKFGIDRQEQQQQAATAKSNLNPKQRRMLSKLAFDPHRPYDVLDRIIDHPQSTLLTKLERILIPHSDEEEIRAQTRTMEAWEDLHESATALALLGWEPIAEKNANNQNGDNSYTIWLRCPICLAELKIVLQKYDSHHHHRITAQKEQEDEDESSSSSPPPSKRQRKTTASTSASCCFNPLEAHRFHCPYVCGFPRDGQRKTTPIWEIIANRLLKNHQQKKEKETNVSKGGDSLVHGGEENEEENNSTTKDNEGEAAMDRILQLLQSGVSSRPPSLSPRHQQPMY